ncbi:leucine-rich repeat domain-containing protein [Abyssisolibacter fermentans]|uniref:leucine-rich repeat domain-containing protein n=1 Tax=Abyssisolibacter fermentans TaxID=1766203 RepID=UPI00082AC739|nr:leucine-rich repeat domain-containing protein [Abyssisolibacter fermentans]
MKKRLIVLLVVLCIFISLHVQATNVDWKLYKDTQLIKLDNQFEIVNNKIYLPVKEVLELSGDKVTINDSNIVAQNDDLHREFMIYNEYGELVVVDLFYERYSSMYVNDKLYTEIDFFKRNTSFKITVDYDKKEICLNPEYEKLYTAINDFIYNNNMMEVSSLHSSYFKYKENFKISKKYKSKTEGYFSWNNKECQLRYTLLGKTDGVIKMTDIPNCNIDIDYFDDNYVDGYKIGLNNKKIYSISGLKSSNDIDIENIVLEVLEDSKPNVFKNIVNISNEILKNIAIDNVDVECMDKTNHKYKIKFNDLQQVVSNSEDLSFEINCEIDDNKLTGLKCKAVMEDNNDYLEKITLNMDYDIKYVKNLKALNKKIDKLKEETSKEVLPKKYDIHKVVTFKDPLFEKIVRKEINKPVGDIYPLELLGIEYLDDDLLDEEEKINNIDGIQYMLNLEELYLNDNSISDISYLSGLTNLQDLAMYNNKISDISALRDLENLELLNLENNKIKDISCLKDLCKLDTLVLNNNNIDRLPRLSGISLLELGSNNIKDISSIVNMYGLWYLDISNNQISDISWINSNIDLEIVDLSNNKIIELPSFENLTEIMELDLSNNKISDIETLGSLQYLEELKAANNNIDSIPVFSTDTLYELDLSSNNITDISNLSNLKSLMELNLSNNNIEDVTPLKDMYLSWLFLDYNQIKNIDMLEFSELEKLTLSNNQVESINPNYIGANTIEILDISNNKIKKLDFLLKLNNLKNLIISGNPIEDNTILNSLMGVIVE